MSKGDMTYEQYELHRDAQIIWSWITIPIYLILCIWAAIDWTSGRNFTVVEIITLAVPIVTALFVFSGATAHKGLSVGKWILFTYVVFGLGGILGQHLVDNRFGSEEAYWSYWFGTILMWIGYTYCCVSEIKSMKRLEKFLVDGDMTVGHEFMKSIEDWNNEQKKRRKS